MPKEGLVFNGVKLPASWDEKVKIKRDGIGRPVGGFQHRKVIAHRIHD